jgi:hypothetical protein
MPELQDHAAAGDVHRLRHDGPAIDLLGAVDAWRGDIALSLGRDLCRLGNDQSRTGALGVVECVERVGDIAGARAAACQRRHHDTVLAVQRSERERTEKIGLIGAHGWLQALRGGSLSGPRGIHVLGLKNCGFNARAGDTDRACDTRSAAAPERRHFLRAMPTARCARPLQRCRPPAPRRERAVSGWVCSPS